jgi:hypothetical protein
MERNKLLKQMDVRGFSIDLYDTTGGLVGVYLGDNYLLAFNISIIDHEVFLNNTLVRMIERQIIKIKKDEWSEAELIKFILTDEGLKREIAMGWVEAYDFKRFNIGKQCYIVEINSDETYGAIYKFTHTYKDLHENITANLG